MDANLKSSDSTRTYVWTLNVKPENSHAKIQNSTAIHSRLLVDKTGTYTATVLTSDGESTTINIVAKQFKKTKETFYSSRNGQEDTTHFTYDTLGNRLTRSTDYKSDGTVDRITTFTYDENGNMLTNSSDNNMDGTIDSVQTYTYDSNGNELTAYIDNNSTHMIITNTYDEQGNRLTVSRDYDADGSIDSYSIFTYDNYGNVLTESSDNNGDSINEQVFTYNYTYDLDGNVLISNNSAMDGKFMYTYDKDGNKLTWLFDGSYEYGGSDTYDKYGNLLTTYNYNIENGVKIEMTMTNTWEE